MGQYTSYYLYQKYEQREGQDPIPCTPNVYSVDGYGTMQKVIKIENDPDCGYEPPTPTEPIYRWYQMPISEGYVCDECPELQYRWVESGTTCVGFDKWNRSIEQYSEDGGTTWHNTNPPVYSATSLIEVDSTDCGVSYRWIDLNPSTDYYCSGTTKYYKQQKQKSYDGSTWENVTPAEYQWGGTAETESTDCGYIPPTPTEAKVSYYNNGVLVAQDACGIPSTYMDCESTVYTQLSNENKEKYASEGDNHELLDNNTVTEIVFGDCCKYIGGYRNSLGYKKAAVTNITFSDSVYYVGTCQESFKGFTSLVNVVIPFTNGGFLGGSTFENCSNLETIQLGDRLSNINGYDFEGCTKLKRINSNIDGVANIPTGVTSIYISPFSGCTSITSMTVGINCTEIATRAFAGLTNIQSITFLATTPPTAKYSAGTSWAAFENTNNCAIYVPSESVNAYKEAKGWKKYSSRIQAIP